MNPNLGDLESNNTANLADQAFVTTFTGISCRIAFGSTNTIDFAGVTLFTEGDSPFPAPTVPEPTTLSLWSLLGLAAVGLGWRRRKRR